jgi:hypothetical protein
MPILGKQNLETLHLPSTAGLAEAEQAIVTVNTAITPADLADSEAHETMLDKAAYALSRLIVSWNFTDETGITAPITIDAVRHLNITDFTFLNKWFEQNLANVAAGLDIDVKKN